MKQLIFVLLLWPLVSNADFIDYRIEYILDQDARGYSQGDVWSVDFSVREEYADPQYMGTGGSGGRSYNSFFDGDSTLGRDPDTGFQFDMVERFGDIGLRSSTFLNDSDGNTLAPVNFFAAILGWDNTGKLTGAGFTNLFLFPDSLDGGIRYDPFRPIDSRIYDRTDLPSDGLAYTASFFRASIVNADGSLSTFDENVISTFEPGTLAMMLLGLPFLARRKLKTLLVSLPLLFSFNAHAGYLHYKIEYTLDQDVKEAYSAKAGDIWELHFRINEAYADPILNRGKGRTISSFESFYFGENEDGTFYDFEARYGEPFDRRFLKLVTDKNGNKDVYNIDFDYFAGGFDESGDLESIGFTNIGIFGLDFGASPFVSYFRDIPEDSGLLYTSTDIVFNPDGNVSSTKFANKTATFKSASLILSGEEFPVPEPTTFGMMLLGLPFILIRRLKTPR